MATENGGPRVMGKWTVRYRPNPTWRSLKVVQSSEYRDGEPHFPGRQVNGYFRRVLQHRRKIEGLTFQAIYSFLELELILSHV